MACGESENGLGFIDAAKTDTLIINHRHSTGIDALEDTFLNTISNQLIRYRTLDTDMVSQELMYGFHEESGQGTCAVLMAGNHGTSTLRAKTSLWNDPLT